MLAEHHSRAELAVDAPERGEKLRRGNGVELARRLVEQQHRRLHHHDGRQIEQLLLPARQLGDGPVKPVLDAEKRRHLCHAAADGWRITAQALQPEGQLMPDLVGHELIVGVLQHEADPLALRARIEFAKRRVFKPDLSRTHAVRCERRLELAQQRRLAAARRAAQADEAARPDTERDILQRGHGRVGIGKGQVSDRKRIHTSASLHRKITGVRPSAR